MNVYWHDRRPQYSCLHAVFDFVMLIATGGLWLIWILARYLRTH